MFKRWSVALAAFALLLFGAGVSSAQHGGGGHGGGGGGHGGGGGGGMHSGGGGGHNGGYYGGGYNHGGYYGGYRGVGIGIGLGLGYGYGGYGYSYPYYAAPTYAYSYAPSAYYAAPTNIYVPSSSLYVPGPDTGSGGNEVPLPLPRQATNKATVDVTVPANAEVWIDDVKTKQTGESRSFVTPDLEPGRPYLYDIRAKWVEDGKPVERKQEIRVEAGKATRVDFVPPK